MSGDLVLGVDGGGSKTAIALADGNGRIVRQARGPGINPLDNRDWRGALTAALTPFAAEPGLAAVAAALPVYGEVEAISAAQHAAVAALFGSTPQRLLNDVDAAQIGAFAGGPGILILSGTGSMAWARDAAGRSFRVGGWGDVVGDEGSSHWIGHRVLGLVSQSLDGRAPPTGLVEALFQSLGLGAADPADALEGWVARLSSPRAEIAALAPLATRLAEAGDAEALGIVAAAADELVRHVTAIAPKVGSSADWSYAGGTFASQVLRDAVAARLARRPVQPKLPPIGGALLAAAQLAGWSTDAAFVGRLGASLHGTSGEHHELQRTA